MSRARRVSKGPRFIGSFNEPTIHRKVRIFHFSIGVRLFLVGLQRYGKGDWRSISRNAVVSRTPTQVASHAQKYFLRQLNSAKKDRKRSSIHDVAAAADPEPSGPAHFENWAGHFPSPSAGAH